MYSTSVCRICLDQNCEYLCTYDIHIIRSRYLVAILPVVAFGSITEGSLTAELGVRYTGAGDRVTVIAMNLLVVAAVTLTFPVQFYPAIEVIETRLGMRGDAQGALRLRRQRGAGRSEHQGVGGYALVGSSDAEDDAGDRDSGRYRDTEQEVGDSESEDQRSRRRGQGTAGGGQEYQQLLQEEGEEGSGDEEASIYMEGAEDALLASEAAASEEDGRGSSCACMKRLTLRCACVLFAAAVALAVPNLELVIALFGSLNAPLLAMILPPVMAMKVLDGGASSSSSPRLHCLIAVIGFVGCASGTTIATMEILEEVL